MASLRILMNKDTRKTVVLAAHCLLPGERSRFANRVTGSLFFLIAGPMSPTELLLANWKQDPETLGTLLTRLYEEIHQLAERTMRRERIGHTLQAGDLLNEVYFKFADLQQEKVPSTRQEFFGLAAVMMRHFLIDYGRARKAQKRGGHLVRKTLNTELLRREDDDEALSEIGRTLDALKQNPAHRTVMFALELKYFLDLTFKHVADIMGISESTAKRHVKKAKRLLRETIEGQR